MGCVCAKAVTRSMSLREELNYGFQSTAVAWEELMGSHSGKDQLFAGIRSTSNSYKLDTNTRTSTPTARESDTIPASKGEVEETGSGGRLTRSKSCQMLREKEEPETNIGIISENKLEWKDKNLLGSRSFHTVEEYDALLERIRIAESIPDHDSSLEDAKPQSVGDDRFEIDNRETGWKRKAAAKGLRTLDVPAVEFPAIGRRRQWPQAEGHVYSPGTYVTPKFGSYNNNKRIVTAAQRRVEDGGGENSAFIPELVAAFEDCMQQLQVEEEMILSHMDECLPIDDESAG